MTVDLSFWKSVEPEVLFRAIADEENLDFVIRVLRTLTPDPVWTRQIVEQVEAGDIETRCFVSWLARELQPQTYLEVGVRRGFSMAMVAARVPGVEIYGFDLWLKDYGGVDNPGARFVQSEVKKIGYKKRIHFFSGDSHKTLSALFARKASVWDRIRLGWKSRQRPTTIDLMTVDGDHSLLGAYQDLLDTMPHCTVGGTVVFDDIAPDLSTLDPACVKTERGPDPYGWGDLHGVWRAIQAQFPKFRYFEYAQNPPGVGLAIRLC